MSSPRSRAGSVAQRRKPTCGDITEETRVLFEDPGSGVEPVELEDAAMEIEELEKVVAPTAEWDDQVAGMKRVIGLIKGGALENPAFRQGLGRIVPGLEAAATNLRSALVKQACLTIAMMAKALGPQFDTLGDFVGPMSTQLAHGTQIIAESCKFGILAIVKSCVSRKVLLSIVELAGKRGPAQRAVAAESLGVIMNAWDLSGVASAWARVEGVMVQLLADASQEVRAFARIAMKNLERNDASKFQRIFQKCDPRTRKAVSDSEAAPQMAKVAGERRRAPSVQPVARQKKPKKEVETEEKVQGQRPESPRRSPKIPRRARAVEPVRQAAKPKRAAGVPKSNIPVAQKRKNVNDEEVQEGDAEEAPMELEKDEVVKNEFIMEAGQEREFLARLREIIDEGETMDMAQNLTDIAIGVIKCCINPSPQIRLPALGILHDIIPPFSSHFLPSLPKLVNLLVHLIETCTDRASSTAQLILNDLGNYYHVNILLEIAGRHKPAPPILNLVGRLIDEPDAALTIDELCMPLLSLATHFHDSKVQTLAHTAAHIIIRIEDVNHNVVKQFAETLVGKDKDEFEVFLHRYLPEVSFEQVDIDIPRFEPRRASEFRNTILELVNTVSDRDWAGIRSRVYTELSESLFYSGTSKQTLLLIMQIFETRGISEYHKLLPGLLHQMRGEYRQLVDNMIMTLFKETSGKELVSSIQQLVLNPDASTSKAAIDLIRRLLSSVMQRDIVSVLPGLFPVLTRAFQSEVPEVRKAVVLCFVEMKVGAGTDVDAFISQLSKSQQRLISVYYSRRVQ